MKQEAAMFNRIRPFTSIVRLTLLIALLAVFVVPASLATPVQAQSIDDGLVGYWPFDEGSGTTSTDYSGSGNHATLHSMAGFTNVTPALDQGNPFAFKSVISPESYASAPG